MKFFLKLVYLSGCFLFFGVFVALGSYCPEHHIYQHMGGPTTLVEVALSFGLWCLWSVLPYIFIFIRFLWKMAGRRLRPGAKVNQSESGVHSPADLS